MQRLKEQGGTQGVRLEKLQATFYLSDDRMQQVFFEAQTMRNAVAWLFLKLFYIIQQYTNVFD